MDSLWRRYDKSRLLFLRTLLGRGTPKQANIAISVYYFPKLNTVTAVGEAVGLGTTPSRTMSLGDIILRGLRPYDNGELQPYEQSLIFFDWFSETVIINPFYTAMRTDGYKLFPASRALTYLLTPS